MKVVYSSHKPEKKTNASSYNEKEGSAMHHPGHNLKKDNHTYGQSKNSNPAAHSGMSVLHPADKSNHNPFHK